VTTPTEALTLLEKAGTAQARKAHARHGVTRRMYGVSPAACRAIARKIGCDQTLAATLWVSGNHDARVLATLIADPGAIDAATLDRWVADCDNHLIADAVSELVARAGAAKQLAERWSRDLGEWRSAIGWSVVGLLAATPGGPDDDWFRAFLPVMTETIHLRPNRTRHCMNGALIAIGLRSAALQKDALRVAGRIGAVQVDHGETGERTPPAASAIAAGAATRKEAAARATEAAVAKPPPTPPPAEAPAAAAAAGTLAAVVREPATRQASATGRAKPPASRAAQPSAARPARPSAARPAARGSGLKAAGTKVPAAAKPAAKKPATAKRVAPKPAGRKPARTVAAARQSPAKRAARRAVPRKPAAKKAAPRPIASKPAAKKAAPRAAARKAQPKGPPGKKAPAPRRRARP